MKISVQVKHISRGVPHAAESCPIALAVNDTLELSEHCSVAGPYGHVFKTEGVLFFRLPRLAAEFVSHFDNGLPVEPFEFELQFSKELEEPK